MLFGGDVEILPVVFARKSIRGGEKATNVRARDENSKSDDGVEVCLRLQREDSRAASGSC